jgi:hypothetical protein
LLAALLVVVSCTLESKFSLPKTETIDAKLLGNWHLKSDNDSEDLILIEAYDEITYKITLNNDILLAYSATFKGHRIMNIIDESNEKLNIFYGFILKKDKLRIMEVSDQINQEDFNSQKELVDFFEKNVSHPDFFVNPDVMKRKK